jgi:Spy/CpxP family protein refolding chaperone
MALAAAGIFACGMVCGAGLTLLVVVHSVRQAVQHPERRPPQGANWLAHKLDLTPPQREQVLRILEEQNADLIALRRENWPRVNARLEKTEAEIAKVLRPEQQEKWHRLAAQLRARWLPGMEKERPMTEDGGPRTTERR